MELIHADNNFVQIGIAPHFEQYDAVSGLGERYSDNDFELSLAEMDWLNQRIEIGHFLYEEGSEWGGRVEDIRHVSNTVYCGGPTWRGMLSRKVISPPPGQAYLIITSTDANAALALLIGNSLGSLFEVSTEASGIMVSGSFRYTNLLAGIHNMLQKYGARLDIVFDGVKVKLSAKPVVDYTEEIQLDQDYAAPLESSLKNGQAYNHVIALGGGQLINRTVVEMWRTEAGTITSTPQPPGLEDKQFVLDYPNAESVEELTNSAVAALIDNAPVKEINIDLSEVNASLQIGDVVGGNDRVTNMKLKQPVTRKILTIDDNGKMVNYKAGD